jgi:hypothetical protein
MKYVRIHILDCKKIIIIKKKVKYIEIIVKIIKTLVAIVIIRLLYSIAYFSIQNNNKS